MSDTSLNPNGLSLLQFESNAYLAFLELVIQFSKKSYSEPKYGTINGFASYIALAISLDCSVFLFEALKHMSEITGKNLREELSDNFLTDLENVRNSIHTYNKHGSFRNKANQMIKENLVEYKMERPDFLYFLRSDIALVFEIINTKRKFMGSNYFINHSFSDKDGKIWQGNQFKNYATNLSAAIKGIASTADSSIYQLPPLNENMELPDIELFDYKSADVFARINVDKSIIMRLLLVLSQISFPIILHEEIINKASVFESPLWFCFFSKLISIKYDEAFDNLNSILTHVDDTDRIVVQKILEAAGININKLRAREFARKLRNSIHYQNIPFDASLCKDGTTIEIVKILYLSITETKTLDEFHAHHHNMLNEIKQLQFALQDAFSLNKVY